MGKKYSHDLNDWVVDQIPRKVRHAMHEIGWNVWGIYEVCREGISLEKRGKLTKETGTAKQLTQQPKGE